MASFQHFQRLGAAQLLHVRSGAADAGEVQAAVLHGDLGRPIQHPSDGKPWWSDFGMKQIWDVFFERWNIKLRWNKWDETKAIEMKPIWLVQDVFFGW